ncbi:MULTISPECIES: signal peptidase I [Bacillus]|uniref:signal peptidase I n=1 Tax=Bacillus TaxID=1386 RepID=UPI000417486E|nr:MULTISPECIES: signal peptidase I [Bacillus]QHZ46147.1 signal peptidase I [Bacillus sp. NSP9.1]WFA06373.1 signal peptidase I [Bacillus sp. HSf4]
MKKRFWVIAGVLFIIIGIQVKNAVFIEYKVEGVSMNPTFQEGNKLLINRFAHHFQTIGRFDIVLFKGPEKDIFIKRVIGLPGETLRYEDDQLYINEKKIKEPYLDDLKAVTAGGDLTGDFTLKEVTGEEKIPANHYFVLGDNRIHSNDSRHFGFVSDKDIVGIVAEKIDEK